MPEASVPVPPAAWVKKFEAALGVLGSSALKRLVAGGVDRANLYYYLYKWVSPDYWDGIAVEMPPAVKRRRDEVRRHRLFAECLRSVVEPRLAQAIEFFRPQSENPLRVLLDQLPKAIKELEELCALSLDPRSSLTRAWKSPYDFVSPVMYLVLIPFGQRKRNIKPWTDDLALLLNAAVAAHAWRAHPRPRQFRGDSIRRYMERHRGSVKLPTKDFWHM
jgi:hypothetical protein